MSQQTSARRPLTSLPARLGATAIASALVVSAGTVPASAAPTPTGIKVLLYADPTYVDVGTQQDVTDGDFDHEGINLQLALQAAGNSVSRVSTTSAAAFGAALAGQHVFVIPETEEKVLGPDLDAATIKVVRDWVAAGGTLIASDDYSGNLNALFGWTLTDTSGPEDDEWELSAAPGAAYVGGPASLPNNDGSDDFATESLPAGAVPVYADPVPGSTLVFDVPYGRGNVAYLGWDWYDAAPANPTGQDSGWNAVLQRAVTTGKPAPVVTAPGAPSRLQVKGKKTARKFSIVWSAPTSTGGAPVLRYQLVVTQKGRTVVSTTLASSKRRYVVKAAKLARARKATVRLRAVNSAGPGTWRTATIRTKR